MANAEEVKKWIPLVLFFMILGVIASYIVLYLIKVVFKLNMGIPGPAPFLSFLLFFGIMFVAFKLVFTGDLMSVKALIIAGLTVLGLILLSKYIPNLLPVEFSQSMSILGKQAMSLLKPT